MTRPLTRVLRGALTAILVALPSGACASARASEGTVVNTPFLDDFSGPAGARPNPDHWTIDVGSSAEHGWEEGSLQTYTDAADNVRLDGEGHLVLEARKDGDTFTSGRVVTRGKLNFGFGTIVAGIKVPSGQGIWPAFWMLGADIDTVGWPQSGEIDIIELINGADTYNISLHAPGADIVTKGSIPDLSRDFHRYWVTRLPDSITIGIDDHPPKTFTRSSLPAGAQWVFNDPMFVLLNVAVGGTWPGPPDESTRFPAAMLVDWLRFEPLN